SLEYYTLNYEDGPEYDYINGMSRDRRFYWTKIMEGVYDPKTEKSDLYEVNVPISEKGLY
ncbi:MAG: hypothetical protein K2L89_03065, partial [Muribaculaceae bacterium]|nr:hypothetical protein [Muribaculaceae bacterium]